jgi:uncharacterized membrane protein
MKEVGIQEPRRRAWSFGVREMVLAAIFSALVIVMQLIGIGSIPVPNLSGAMTTLLIPVLLGAIIGGPVVGMIAGLTMGIVYMTLPITAPFGPITLIVPRLMMALAAWAMYRVLVRFSISLASILAGTIGSLVNTICAVGIAILLGQVPLSFVLLVIPQAVIEAVACAIIIPVIVVGVDKALKARE